jgi:hypothetical protein
MVESPFDHRTNSILYVCLRQSNQILRPAQACPELLERPVQQNATPRSIYTGSSDRHVQSIKAPMGEGTERAGRLIAQHSSSALGLNLRKRWGMSVISYVLEIRSRNRPRSCRLSNLAVL